MRTKAIAFVLALASPFMATVAFPFELAIKWRTEVPTYFHNRPVLSKGFVLVASRGQAVDPSGAGWGVSDEADGLYILDSETRKMLHLRTPSDAGGIALADVDEDGSPEALVGCWDGSVYIYRMGAVSSRPLKLSTGYIVASTPTVSDLDGDGSPEILVANSLGNLFCFEPDGTLLWQYKETKTAWILSTPAVADLDGNGSPEIVIGNSIKTSAGTKGTLYCFDARGGLLWKFPTEDQVLSSPAVGDLDGDGSPEIVFGSLDHNLYCLGPDGSLKWKFSTGGEIFSSPALANVSPEGGLEIVFGSKDSTVYCLSSEGAEIWAFKTEGPVVSSPALADLDGDGRIDVVVGDLAGVIYVLGPSGEGIWKFEAGSEVASSPAVGDLDGDGRLEVVVPSKETLYCFEASAAGRIAWAKFHGDSWNTGLLANAVSYGIFSSKGFPGVWTPVVVFPDPNLEEAIREEIEKPRGPITPKDVAELRELDASGRGISDLRGIEHCFNLKRLRLSGNEIEDIRPLGALTNLVELYLDGNRIVDIAPLGGLTKLQELDLGGNLIADIAPLRHLTNLRKLYLYDNNIGDIAPLLENLGLGEGDEVDLRGNPLSEKSLEIIRRLEARGVKALYLRPIPTLKLFPRELNFGEVAVGDTSLGEVEVSNVGTDTLVVKMVTIGRPEAEVHSLAFRLFPRPPLPWKLPPEANKAIQILFSPQSSGLYCDTLWVISNDPSGPKAVALAGMGVAPELVLSAESLSFGEVPVGEQVDSVLSIYNRGKAELRIISTSLTYGTKFELSEDLSGKVVGPGGSLTVTVRFVPTEAGELTDTLVVRTNDPARPEARVVLSGFGLKLPKLEVSVGKVDFGQVQLGSHKDTLLSIHNRGNADLEISQATLASGEAFELLGDIGRSTVPPAGSIDLGVSFRPVKVGGFKDALVVRSNDPENPEVHVPLTGTGIDTIPPIVEYSPPPPGFKITSGQSFKVLITARDPSGIDSALFCWRLGGEREFFSSRMGSIGGDTLMTVLSTSDVSRGLEFYLKVMDGAGNIWESQHYTVRGNVTGKGIERPFPTFAKRYQMISLPIVPENLSPKAILEPVLGPYDRTKWRLFWWDPDEKKYIEYPRIEALMPELGYWLITKEPCKLYTGPGESTPLDTIPVGLKPGWNMIGCPFAFPVAWGEVEGHGEVQPPVGYDGTKFIYDQLVLRPWEGYAVYNPKDYLVTIKFPPLEAVPPKPALSSLLDLAEASGGWAVQLEAEAEGSRDTYNFLGWMPEASDTWDGYERAEVPPLPGFVSLYFDHRSWPDVPGLHTTDVRPAGRERYTWKFFVLAPSGSVRLSWRHTGLPEGLRGRIVDEGTGTWSELKPSGEYKFRSDGSARAFELVVESSAPAPEGYGLSAFPNPFNSSVSIVAEVPEPGSELVVYDVKGTRVRTLARGVPPGRYVLSWDGRDDGGRPAGSGVYILRLGRLCLKLVLMR